MIRLVLQIVTKKRDCQHKNTVSVLTDLSLQITEFGENINRILRNALIITTDKISLPNNTMPSIFFFLL